jgi:hypothetical protein
MASQPPRVEPTIENLIKNNNNYQIFRKLKDFCNSETGDLTEEKETEYYNIVDKIIRQYAKAGFNGTKPPTFINWVHKHIPSFSQSSIKCLKPCFVTFQEEGRPSWNFTIMNADSDKRASTSTR